VALADVSSGEAGDDCVPAVAVLERMNLDHAQPLITSHAEVCGVHAITTSGAHFSATPPDRSPRCRYPSVMSPTRPLTQTPIGPEDHPFGKARRHQRLFMQEVAGRARVAIHILILAELTS